MIKNDFCKKNIFPVIDFSHVICVKLSYERKTNFINKTYFSHLITEKRPLLRKVNIRRFISEKLFFKNKK